MIVVVKVVKSIEMKVDDKFDKLADEEFWINNLREADDLASELIETIHDNDLSIEYIEGVENNLGEVMMGEE